MKFENKKCNENLFICLFFLISCAISTLNAEEPSNKPISLIYSNSEQDWAKGALIIKSLAVKDNCYLPLLIQRLKEATSDGAKCNLLHAIKSYRSQATEAVPVIIPMLQDRSDVVVSCAIEALAEIKSCPHICVPALIKAGRTHAKQQWLIARSLGTWGREANDALPFLENLKKSNNSTLPSHSLLKTTET